MIKEFVHAWEKNKDKLEKHLANTPQSEYSEYKDLVRLLFDLVINPEINTYTEYRFDTEHMLVIDDGHYRGTQIFVLHRKTYEPNVEDYVYTNTYYGSCSGCDTLLKISGYNDGLPSKYQVKDYMTLCLHLLQKCTYMVDPEEN